MVKKKKSTDTMSNSFIYTLSKQDAARREINLYRKIRYGNKLCNSKQVVVVFPSMNLIIIYRYIYMLVSVIEHHHQPTTTITTIIILISIIYI